METAIRESGQPDKVLLSAGEVIKYIDKCERAVRGIIYELDSEKKDLYRIFAVDDEVLSEEASERYNQAIVRSSMNVLQMAKLLTQITEELVQLKIAASQALGKAGILYNQKACMGILTDTYADSVFCSMEGKLSRLSRRDAVKTEHFMKTSSHMSSEDEALEYRYPVIRTKRLLLDQTLVGKLTADIQRHFREQSRMVREQINHITIEYTPGFDMHADWHNWTVEV